jgi:hypothetical protein
MLIITGPGRCGTSCLAAVLKAAHCDPGGDWHPASEIRAGFEDPKVVAINSTILEGRDDLRTEVHIQNVQRLVVKDPLFTVDGAKPLKHWWRHRKDLRVLLLVREPRRILASLAAHPEYFPGVDSEDHNTLIATYWRRGVETAAFCLRAGIPLRMLTFPDFLSQYSRVEKALLGFGKLPVPAEWLRAAWEKVVDVGKVRF